MNTDGGSAMSVADGVKFHNEAVAILGDGYVIGAPAVANHPEGEQWLDVSEISSTWSRVSANQEGLARSM